MSKAIHYHHLFMFLSMATGLSKVKKTDLEVEHFMVKYCLLILQDLIKLLYLVILCYGIQSFYVIFKSGCAEQSPKRYFQFQHWHIHEECVDSINKLLCLLRRFLLQTSQPDVQRYSCYCCNHFTFHWMSSWAKVQIVRWVQLYWAFFDVRYLLMGFAHH